ncbi:HAD family hydrolase [Streptomyces sp. NPDC051561]|uniref:HAD family hydrolase n=1 Tax=Streptomyces sp. NPDC051561 TaxID=3365658 RepID=UPI0037B601FA
MRHLHAPISHGTAPPRLWPNASGSPLATQLLRRGPGTLPKAVVLDLFGTLVPAPLPAERASAAVELAVVMGVATKAAEASLISSWRSRHDGTLRSTKAVAAHLVERCDAPSDRTDAVETALHRLASSRLRIDASVLQALVELRGSGVKLALLSDASPDVAEQWDVTAAVSSHFEAAVFSCREGALKPHPKLYSRALSLLGVESREVVYCGDGGGNELAGAQRFGMRPVKVARRGGTQSLVFGEKPWTGMLLTSVEDLPSALADGWGQ